MRAFDSIALVAGGPQARKLPFLGDADSPPLVGQPWADIELSRQFLQNNSESMQSMHDAAALGIAVGCLVHIAAAALGVAGTVVVWSPWAERLYRGEGPTETVNVMGRRKPEAP